MFSFKMKFEKGLWYLIGLFGRFTGMVLMDYRITLFVLILR